MREETLSTIDFQHFISILGSPTLQQHPEIVVFSDLLAKAYLAKTLAAFGKTFERRSGTRFGFLLVPRGVIRPIYTYFELNSSNIGILSSYYQWLEQLN